MKVSLHSAIWTKKLLTDTWKKAIPLKIEGFADAIEQMFGIASKLVEIRMIEAFHKRFPEFVFLPKKGDVDFKEYMVALRAFLLYTFIS